MLNFLRSLFTPIPGSFRALCFRGNAIIVGVAGLFGAIVIGMAFATFLFLEAYDPANFIPHVIAFVAILAIGFIVVLFDILLRNKQITTISAIYFGLLLGLLLGNIFSTALEPFIFFQCARPGRSDAASFQYQRKGLALMITGRLLLCVDFDVVADQG